MNGDEKTYNDPQDPDQGPNDLLNHPIIELAVTDSTGSVVAGRIETTPYTRITVEVLIGSEPGNILSFSQAPLGTVEVVTDASGIGRWIVETDRSFAIGPTINAIAHNSSSGSSELSIKSGASLSVKRKLSLSQPSIAENGGSLSLTVYRASIDPVGNVNVSLSSSDPSRLQLPLAVVIPFGQQSVTVQARAIDDSSYHYNEVLVFADRGVVGLQIEENESPWHNYTLLLDVNGNGIVSPRDALEVINFLNGSEDRFLGNRLPEHLPGYLDINLDNVVTPSDALKIINHLNSRSEGEADGGASADILASLADIDFVISNLDYSQFQSQSQETGRSRGRRFSRLAG